MTTEIKQLEWLSTQYNGSTEGLSDEFMDRSVVLVNDLNVLDTFKALAERGPLYTGDLPSKNERSLLVAAGLATPCVVKGEDGYYALTYFGLAVYKHLVNGRLVKTGESTDVEFTTELAVRGENETIAKALISIQSCSDAVTFLSKVRWCPICANEQYWWHSKMCRLGLIKQIRRISNGVDPDKVTYAITDIGSTFLDMLDSHVSRFVSATALMALGNFEHADAMPLLNSSGSTVAAMKEGLIVKMSPAPQTPDTHSYYQLTSNGIRARELLLGKGNNK